MTILFNLNPLLVLVSIPLIFALLILLLKHRYILFISQLFTLLLTAYIWHSFSAINNNSNIISFPWISDFNINFSLTLDNLSLCMISLTTIVTFFSSIFLINEKNHHQNFKTIKNPHIYIMLLLLCQSSLYLTFLASDIFLFYFSWEITLLPIIFLLLIWGGEKRTQTALKLFLYTLCGSLCMLFALIFILVSYYKTTHTISFDYLTIKDFLSNTSLSTSSTNTYFWCFLAITFSFLIKIPAVPFHGWQADSYEQLPIHGSIYLSALLAKMGTYGLLRYSANLFKSENNYNNYNYEIFIIIGIISIIYGGIVALKQTDIKKFIAYSSISHSGFIIVGVFSLSNIATTGAIYQMFNHAIYALTMFLIAYHFIIHFHSSNTSNFPDGLASKVPIFSIIFFITMLSSLAIPGTNNFVGEFMILLGTSSKSFYFCALAASGVIVSAIYSLNFYKNLMFASNTNSTTSASTHTIKDLTALQAIFFTVIILLIILIGVFPNNFLYKFNV
ncbi:MAG: NADH-quinone oxidoreductase subunit M [Oligoflexia bacterium]|nr:NADH-quinone oxidoreductase subunit M [Oligoflexia bacterium]